MIEPELIKAGDARVKLGIPGSPPKIDCRVISEDNYQQLKRVCDESLPNLLGALEAIEERMKECIPLGLTAHEAYDSFYQEMVSSAIEKATE